MEFVTKRKLGDLRDPEKFNGILNISGYNKILLHKMLSSMLLIRKTEEAIANLIKTGFAVTPCHLCVGQEAIAVGVSQHLVLQDKVFGCHRSHAHLLALNHNPYSLIAEVLGKKTGCSKGMGGSMHLVDLKYGFYGSVPIVGGTIPIAVGAALAEKIRKSNFIAVAYFGDGACEEGVLHESLNLAALYKLPVLFVCENNLYSSHTDIDLRQPTDSTSRFADAHSIKSKTVDGNDVLEVYSAAEQLVKHIRAGYGAAFLEVVTYRWLGHVGANSDIDVGVNRKLSDLQAWQKRDPINRLMKAMLEAGIISDIDYASMTNDIQEKINQDIEQAKKDDYPSEKSMMDFVYSIRGD
jgi:pyruvate dehydrogenase E1 component alpha subunit